jgi:hypothetical protein
MSEQRREPSPEEKALDALIVAAFKEDSCEVDYTDIERYGQALSPEERAKLDALGAGFIDALFAGEVKQKTKQRQTKGELSTAMNRSDNEEPPSEKAQDEMERKVKEAEEKRRQDDESAKS